MAVHGIQGKPDGAQEPEVWLHFYGYILSRVLVGKSEDEARTAQALFRSCKNMRAQ